MTSKTGEKMVHCFYGINREHEVERIAVYKSGNEVRLSGRRGSHVVYQESARNSDGWKQETAVVFELRDIVDVPAILFDSDSERRKVQDLWAKAAARKAAAQARQS